ncbi:MAG: uracil-DNA glycosylase [Clostridiales bacterium]|nr:uracil-DNA glycosylase [Clostridiales bacterium]
MVHIGNDWDALLAELFDSPSYAALREFLIAEYRQRRVYPNMHDIFNALKMTSCADTKVVILGQDPYHGPGQAHGLSFSVRRGCAPPPSLRNIFEELRADCNVPTPEHGDLSAWAAQGVLLLNAVLTVREGQPNSHRGRGWELVTDAVMDCLNEKESPVVFLLWGANAQSKAGRVTNSKHLKLFAPHPSPLSSHRGFAGCGHFSKTNSFLASTGQVPIDWNL